MAYEIEYIKAAHGASKFHRDVIEKSTLCGCFYCLRGFAPSEIKEWTDRKRHKTGEVFDKPQTAICPHCGIDAVIGDASGYPIDGYFLNEMKAYWF